MATIGLAMSNFFLSKDVPQTISFAQKHGFTGIEIWAEVPFCHPDLFGERERKKLKKMLNENGLVYTLHSPMFGIDIGSVNPGIRKESIRQTKAGIDLIKELDGEIIIIHPPKTPFKMSSQDKPSRFSVVKKHVFQLAKEAIGEIKQYAKKKGITVVLENCGVEFNDWEENLADFLSLVDECKVNVCLDIGHAHCSWGLEKTFQAVKEKIKCIHISDNRGKRDEHLPVGMGNINYHSILPDLRNFSGLIVHEIQYSQNDEWGTIESKKNLDKILEVTTS